MPNKTCEHGGFITEGTVIRGTLRDQDLLRAFADEVERISPFNTAEIRAEARETADLLDEDDVLAATAEAASELVADLQDRLCEYAVREGGGLYFGTAEGDGSDFGFWRAEDCDADDLVDA